MTRAMYAYFATASQLAHQHEDLWALDPTKSENRYVNVCVGRESCYIYIYMFIFIYIEREVQVPVRFAIWCLRGFVERIFHNLAPRRGEEESPEGKKEIMCPSKSRLVRALDQLLWRSEIIGQRQSQEHCLQTLRGLRLQTHLVKLW